MYGQGALLLLRTLLTDYVSRLEGQAGRWIIQQDFDQLSRVLAMFVGVSGWWSTSLQTLLLQLPLQSFDRTVQQHMPLPAANACPARLTPPCPRCHVALALRAGGGAGGGRQRGPQVHAEAHQAGLHAPPHARAAREANRRSAWAVRSPPSDE